VVKYFVLRHFPVALPCPRSTRLHPVKGSPLSYGTSSLASDTLTLIRKSMSVVSRLQSFAPGGLEPLHPALMPRTDYSIVGGAYHG
jgi:hypothetical protein